MRHKIFVGYVAFMVLAFLVPVPTTPLAEVNHVDKLVHFGIFLGFALLLYIDRASKMVWMLLISFAFAGESSSCSGFCPTETRTGGISWLARREPASESCS